MKTPATRSLRRRFYAALVGTAVVAVCCFTPVLVIILGGLGLSFFTPYLDYVLFPALILLVALTAVSYMKWKRAAHGLDQTV